MKPMTKKRRAEISRAIKQNDMEFICSLTAWERVEHSTTTVRLREEKQEKEKQKLKKQKAENAKAKKCKVEKED